MLKNKTLFITGGTSTLGEAIVKKTLENHAAVFFTYYKNQSKKSELEKLGAKAIFCDLNQKKTIQECIQTLLKETSHLDFLINNAAVARDHTIKNMSEEEWDEVLQVNLKGPIHLTYGLVGAMNGKNISKIFNVISRQGMTGSIGDANYCASKDTLIEFTKYTAHEFAEKNILVNALNPGFMLSGMTKKLPEKIIQLNKEKSLLGTVSDPNEVAEFIVYLLSDKTTKVTGHIFHYDSRALS